MLLFYLISKLKELSVRTDVEGNIDVAGSRIVSYLIKRFHSLKIPIDKWNQKKNENTKICINLK